MATNLISSTMTSAAMIPTFRILARQTWRPSTRSFFTKPLQASARDEASAASDRAGEAIKKGTKEAEKTFQDAKGRACSSAEEGKEKMKDTASKISENAKEMTDKAKQTVQDAWGSAKETGQKVKDTVVEKAEDAAESVKDAAAKVKRSMNTKN